MQFNNLLKRIRNQLIDVCQQISAIYPDLEFEFDIQPEGSGTFLVGKKLRVRIVGAHDGQAVNHKGQVIQTETGKQLRVVMDVAPGKTSFVVDYAWLGE